MRIIYLPPPLLLRCRRAAAPLCVGLTALLLLALGGLFLDAQVLRSVAAMPPYSAATTTDNHDAVNRAWRARLGNDDDVAGVELSAQWRVLFCPSSQTPWSFGYLPAAWLRAAELLNNASHHQEEGADTLSPAAQRPVPSPPSPRVTAPYPPHAPPPHPQQPAAAATPRRLHSSGAPAGGSAPAELTPQQLRTMRAFYRWFPGAESFAVMLTRCPPRLASATSSSLLHRAGSDAQVRRSLHLQAPCPGAPQTRCTCASTSAPMMRGKVCALVAAQMRAATTRAPPQNNDRA
jgi:hypothetical protein